MESAPALKRKTFLKGMTCVALAGVAGCGLPAALETGDTSPIAAAMGLVPVPEKYAGLVALGRRYLEKNNNQLPELLKELELEGRQDIFPLTGARERILQRHVQDINESRLLLIDGWMVSRTEARLYAILALR